MTTLFTQHKKEVKALTFFTYLNQPLSELVIGEVTVF